MLNKNLNQLHSYHCIPCFVLIISLLCVSVNSFADENPSITVKTATLSFQDKTYLLNAHINYSLSDEAIEALHNGVSLSFNVDLSIIESRRWLWNKHHNNLSFPYQLRYHTLAEIYQVSDTTNNLQHNFSSLSAALNALGTLSDIPIHSITNDNNFKTNASLKAYLNIEALPLPMRPLAYVTRGWYLRSNTFEWPLAH